MALAKWRRSRRSLLYRIPRRWSGLLRSSPLFTSRKTRLSPRATRVESIFLSIHGRITRALRDRTKSQTHVRRGTLSMKRRGLHYVSQRILASGQQCRITHRSRLGWSMYVVLVSALYYCRETTQDNVLIWLGRFFDEWDSAVVMEEKYLVHFFNTLESGAIFKYHYGRTQQRYGC